VTFSVASSLDESELARKIVYGWEEGIVQVLRSISYNLISIDTKRRM
jgi:hypothetical protein